MLSTFISRESSISIAFSNAFFHFSSLPRMQCTVHRLSPLCDHCQQLSFKSYLSGNKRNYNPQPIIQNLIYMEKRNIIVEYILGEKMRKIVFIAQVVILVVLCSASFASAKTLVLDTPNDNVKSLIKGEDYVIVPIPESGQIKLEDIKFFDQFDKIYMSEGIFVELGNPNYLIDKVRDSSGKGIKTTIKARPDNGMISQKTKVAIQRRASKPVTMLGYSPTGVVALIVPETKVSKDSKFDVGTDHPRTPVHYKIFDPTCADLPVWKICWDYTEKR